MVLVLKLLLLAVLSFIAYQDFKERMVFLFLFPCFAILGGYLYFDTTFTLVFFYNVLINLFFIAIVLLFCFLYSKIVLKKKFTKEVMGLGDILFFVGFAISFPVISFLTLFVFSIIFTTIIYFLSNKIFDNRFKNVPLAGCMAVFLISVYLLNWSGFYNALYTI